MENNVFDNYFDAIFKYSNDFSEKEFRQHFKSYDLNYGPFLPADKNANILDAGSGAGHFLYFLEKKGYKNFFGIDISRQQVDFCKQNVSNRVDKADIFEFLSGKPGFYNAIIMNDLLEHVPKDNIIKLLSLVNNALTPTGKIIIKTPNMGNPFALALRYNDFTHNIGFTEKSLRQVLWMAGFRKMDIFPVRENGLVALVIQLVIRKLSWYQGFTCPKILSSVIIGVGEK